MDRIIKNLSSLTLKKQLKPNPSLLYAHPPFNVFLIVSNNKFSVNIKWNRKNMASYKVTIAKSLSIQAAIFFQKLKEITKQEKPILYNEVYWYPLSESCCFEATALTRKFQRKAIQQLVDGGYIICSPSHLFNRRHFHIIKE